MKKIIMVFMAAALMLGGKAVAQEKKKELTPEQKIEKHTDRMQKRLMLDDATAAKFAPIYKEYLKAKAECRPACEKCENPTDAQIKENISKRLEAQEKANEVEQKYFKKLSSILSGRQLQIIFCNGDKGKFAKKDKDFKGKRGAKNQRPMMQGNCPQPPANCPQNAANCPNNPAK